MFYIELTGPELRRTQFYQDWMNLRRTMSSLSDYIQHKINYVDKPGKYRLIFESEEEMIMFKMKWMT